MPTSALVPVLGLLVAALTAGVLLALYPLVFGLADRNVLGAVPAAVLLGPTAAVLVRRHRSKRSPSA
jgi:hypothetical protein